MLFFVLYFSARGIALAQKNKVCYNNTNLPRRVDNSKNKPLTASK
jgi:hypothetical protein